MVYCCVPTCISECGRTIGVSFHEFPSDNSRRLMWLKNISRKDWVPSQKSVVCSLHFREQDFKEGLKTKRLKPEVCPTLFEKYPSYMQNSIRTQSRKRKCPKARENEIQLEKKKKAHTDVINETTSTKNESRIREPLRSVENDMDMTSLPCPVYENLENGSYAQEALKTVENYKVATSLPCPVAGIDSEATGISLLDTPRNHLKKPGPQPLSTQCLRKKLHLERTRSKRLKASVRKLKNRLLKAKKQAKRLNYKLENSSISHIKNDAQNGVRAAKFLSNQIECYGKKKNTWCEEVIRESIILRAKSPKAYEYTRKRGLLKLPSRMTLKRYTGFVTGEIGCTSLIKQRLSIECSKLKPVEKYGSLIFDEMSIKQQTKYVKCLDRVVGFVDMGDVVGDEGSSHELANRLLCFVYKGLSTFIRIPVSYYFTKQLKSDQLYQLILKVIHDVESTGFTIVRVVCDNNSVNTAALKLMCPGKELQPEISHPEDSTRTLFLSFDYAHIIKNVRSLFLSEKRSLTINGEEITSYPLKVLYKIQKDMTVKPVRFLTRKHVYPTSFEKMNVKRAVEVFSPPVTAALTFLMKRTPELGFQNVEPTVKFMEIIYKWFQLHDVSNTTQYVHQRNPNCQHFFMLDDKRLEWLEIEFINFLDQWRKSTIKKKLHFLSRETYEAMRLTTLSTVKCIRYLLSSGFHFVLSRNLSGDDVEALFSSVRQLMGGNDQTNATGVIFALEKILRVGIVSTTDHSNVQDNFSKENLFKSNQKIKNVQKKCKKNADQKTCLPSIPSLELKITHPDEYVPTTVETVSKAMVAGFICRYLQDRHPCPLINANLTVPVSHAPINSLIKFQDRGALIYPAIKTTSLVLSISNYVDNILKLHHRLKNLKSNIVGRIIPLVMKSNYLECGCKSKEHSENLVSLFVSRLVELLLKNSTYVLNDRADVPKVKKKPLSRKVLKL